MKNHAGKYWPREKQTPFLWPLTSLPESTNVNRFCKFLLLRPTGRMKFSWEPNLVSTPDPRHLVCDKYSNILCFLKYVVGVVMAGVTGRRADELIRTGICVGMEDLVPLTRCSCSMFGQPGWLGDGSHPLASPQWTQTSPNFKFQLLVVQRVPGDLVLEQLLSTVHKTTTEW